MSYFEKNTEKKDFDLEIVLDAFVKCMEEGDSVVLEDYLRAFHELCRFFKLTGRLLGFVAIDLEGKIRSVEWHRRAANWRHYHSVKSMIELEEREGSTHARGSHPSGCRMMLRLHWALEFILAFMDRIRVPGRNVEGEEHQHHQEKISALTWEVYKQTLYHHHPWVTRQLARVAVHALPSRAQLIQVMCKQDYDTVLGLLEQVVMAGRPVHQAIENLFSSHNLLHIS